MVAEIRALQMCERAEIDSQNLGFGPCTLFLQLHERESNYFNVVIVVFFFARDSRVEHLTDFCRKRIRLQWNRHPNLTAATTTASTAAATRTIRKNI